MNPKIQIKICVLVLFSLLSCDLITIDDPVVISNETISAKWTVDDQNSVIKSLEFDESGAYIVITSSSLKSSDNELYYIGNYQIKGNNEIELEDFGTIKVKILNSKNAQFTITLASGDKKEVSVVKGETISESSRTKELCKIWKREPYDPGSFLNGYEMRLFFSNSGTYFASLIDPEGNSLGTLNYWKWQDDTEESVCYSTTSAISCDGENMFQIIELTSTVLKIKNPFDETIDTYHYTSLFK